MAERRQNELERQALDLYRALKIPDGVERGPIYARRMYLIETALMKADNRGAENMQTVMGGWIEALEPHASHFDTCPIRTGKAGGCDCGLDAVLIQTGFMERWCANCREEIEPDYPKGDPDLCRICDFEEGGHGHG